MADIANLSDLAHLHLLLNHVPSIGMVGVVALLLVGYARKNRPIQVVALELLFLIALLTIQVYISGVSAAELLEDQQGISMDAVRIHQDASFTSFVLIELTGFLAWVALWQSRRLGGPRNRSVMAVLILSLITLAVVARAANLGGDIHHPELADGLYAVGSSTGGAWFSAQSVTNFVLMNRWVWPASESLHFLGMSLMFGVLLLVNLRLLGWFSGMSFAAAHRLLPFGILGFGVNLVTGMVFFIGEAAQYTQNVSFHWKMLLLELAGINFLVLTVYDKAWTVEPGDSPRLSARLLAASALALSFGVMYFGRMLPFIGNAF